MPLESLLVHAAATHALALSAPPPPSPACRQTAAHVVGELLSPGGPAFDYLPFFYSRVFSLSWQVSRGAAW